MRQAKFYAYHKTDKLIHAVKQINWDTKGDISGIFVELGYGGLAVDIDLSQLILLQSTLYFDNKGVEVIEGSILELSLALYPKKPKRIAVVVWLDHKPYFRAIDAKDYAANFTNHEKFKVKVIGHIYTTPELIPDAVKKNASFLKYRI